MKIICKYCQKEFEWENRQKKYCSKECRNLGKKNIPLKEYRRICPVCDKEFIANNARSIFCSESCKQKDWKSKNIREYSHICLYCNKEFISGVKKTKFCSLECSATHKNKKGIGIKHNCKNCNNEFSQTNKRHCFCSEKCKSEYGRRNLKKTIVYCSNCNKEIIRPENIIGKRKNFFCCKKCESEFREKEANDIRICKHCNKEFICKKGEKLIFCSKACQISGINKSPTRPHKVIIELLEKLLLSFEIEHPIKRFSIDIYLLDYLFSIEILGKYWHCDVRYYDYPINNKIQLKGIKRDKNKNEYLKNNNMPVLYLWENDIDDDIEICEKLIQEFIKKNGILNNYHSMNYEIKENELKLKQEILIPYFERNDYISPLTTGTRELHL
jgi:G:T-mismatch repair DNA endonuclease (very short patch repair protein)